MCRSGRLSSPAPWIHRTRFLLADGTSLPSVRPLRPERVWTPGPSGSHKHLIKHSCCSDEVKSSLSWVCVTFRFVSVNFFHCLRDWSENWTSAGGETEATPTSLYPSFKDSSLLLWLHVLSTLLRSSQAPETEVCEPADLVPVWTLGAVFYAFRCWYYFWCGAQRLTWMEVILVLKHGCSRRTRRGRSPPGGGRPCRGQLETWGTFPSCWIYRWGSWRRCWPGQLCRSRRKSVGQNQK